LTIERITKRGRNRLTSAALPDQFAGLRRLETAPHPPERPEMGVSVAYGKGEVTGRVALYDRGLSNIPDGPESSTIYDEINRVLADLGERVEIGMYQGAHIIDQYLTRQSGCGVNFFCVEYEYRLRSQRIGAAVCFTGHDGLIVMVSCEQPLPSADTETRRAFVADVAAFLARRGSDADYRAAASG
jgi:hypothetical protein